MTCPECDAEYLDGIGRCSDCDVDLVPVLKTRRISGRFLRRYFSAPQSTRMRSQAFTFANPTPAELVERWAELRRLRTAALVAWSVTVLYVVVALLTVSAIEPGTTVKNGLLVVGAISFVVSEIASVRAAFFQCPRCRLRNAFHVPYTRIPSRRCYRCGLIKWYGEK